MNWTWWWHGLVGCLGMRRIAPHLWRCRHPRCGRVWDDREGWDE
ncbi:MAG TPA: hypothetical protein VMY35_15880 [Phycisphaerae bacterium]|nr:hypothetical protein [Phycisphaerae bacterium]